MHKIMITSTKCGSFTSTNAPSGLISSMEFTILHVTGPEEHAKAYKFVGDVFVPDLPVLRVFGFDNSKPDSPPRQRKYSAESRDFTLKAVDLRGEIIGIAMNKERSELPPLSPETEELHEFFKFMEESANLKSKCEGSIELSILAVCKEWRGKGVATRLAEESTRVARSLGYAAMKMCCISEFTAKLARSLGWREIYRLAYADYSALSGRVVKLAPNSPHDYVYYYVNEFKFD